MISRGYAAPLDEVKRRRAQGVQVANALTDLDRWSAALEPDTARDHALARP
jgi:hypothetical protein